ncbi:MAG: alpha/beta hydrolase family protein [Termitinemataceae bacterium]|nr:MAG: alpha/beta hydrolase family protein [Termitinemataceae bacterium]
MAFLSGNIYSRSIVMDTHIGIFLPQDGRRYIWEDKPKTLILLHGLSDDASVWMRRTSVERYAERYNLALVMPEVQRSFYTDMKNGQKYYQYIAYELPQLIEKMFSVSIEREDLMIAGLSMGGYGAMRIAFDNPDRFAYCGAFSGAYDIAALVRDAPKMVDILGDFPADIRGIFGENPVIPKELEIPEILKNAKSKADKLNVSLPKLYMACGTYDFIHKQSNDIHNLLNELEIGHRYTELIGKYHEWDVWDGAIETFLRHCLGTGREDWQNTQ